MDTNKTYAWYQNLKKPFFAPPQEIFGIVWPILYAIIFVSYGYTVYLVYKKKISKAVLVPLILNLVSNASFSYIQFDLQNNYLALADIIIVLITIIWFIKLILPYSKILALSQIPYLAWVSFATILQISITWLNR